MSHFFLSPPFAGTSAKEVVGWVERSETHRWLPMKGCCEVMGIASLNPSYASLHNPRRDLTAQPFQTEQRVGAGLRDLDTLGREMLAEEIEMRRSLVELLRCQHRRKYGHFGS